MPSDLMNCRVCGYESDTPPWGEDGRTASFDICPCCGVEWGYEDNSVESTHAYREKWLAGGARWFLDDVPHDGLDTATRLAHVPAAFR